MRRKMPPGVPKRIPPGVPTGIKRVDTDNKEKMPKKIIMDADGRMIDEKGKVIEISKPQGALRINQRDGAT